MKVFITIILLFLFPVVALSQSTYYVPDDFSSIQDAINASSNGDTIIVRPGTYVENIDFIGKVITVISEMGQDNTIIDGNDAGSVVTFKTGEYSNSILAGFTITNGNSKGGFGVGNGGGIRCDGSSPTVTSCNISGNVASGHGGGFFAGGGSPVISHCTIAGNWAQGSGGGLWDNSSPVVDGCIFSNNSCVNDGGAIHNHNYNGSPTYPSITNCMFISNSAPWGGAVVNDNSQPHFSNCLFIDNEASTGKGGGISGWYGSKVILVNCTFFGNSAASGGGALLSDGGDTLTNCILWGDRPDEIEFYINPTVTYSCVQGGWSGTGNIFVDPHFVDLANNDFHLTFDSPCRDSGTNDAAKLPAEDFEGDPRIAYGTVDMGADEFYTHLYVTGDKTPGGSIEGKFIGLPSTTPVGLFIGSDILPSPIPTMWGEYWLQAPYVLLGPLGAIPSNGVMVLPTTLPPGMTAPVDVPMQALIGLNADSLSNLEVLEVR